jgi:hypothetical protein
MLLAEITANAIDWDEALPQLLLDDIKGAIATRDEDHLHAAFVRLLEYEHKTFGYVWTPGSKGRIN